MIIKILVLVVFMIAWHVVGYLVNDIHPAYVMLSGWLLALVFFPIFDRYLYGND